MTIKALGDWRKVPRELWPSGPSTADRVEVWLCTDFLVQVFDMPNCPRRLSVNRTRHAGSRWEAGITWDDLQECKRAAGYGDRWAVEVFPADVDLVNVANMRHLWLLDEAPAWEWRRKP
jgi:hypothetical protein